LVLTYSPGGIQCRHTLATIYEFYYSKVCFGYGNLISTVLRLAGAPDKPHKGSKIIETSHFLPLSYDIASHWIQAVHFQICI
jgi:hypothetical protein